MPKVIQPNLSGKTEGPGTRFSDKVRPAGSLDGSKESQPNVDG